MVLSQKLLGKLACPVCHGTLEYSEENEQLTCHRDRLSFRIVEDIPMLNLDEAEKHD